MIKLKWDKIELKFHKKLGEIVMFRIITVISLCFPPQRFGGHMEVSYLSGKMKHLEWS